MIKDHISKIDKYLQVLVSEVLRFYQRDWLSSILDNRYTGILSSRQLGKSLTIAISAIYLAIGFKNSKGEEVQGHSVFIASKDQKTAKNIISMINKQLDTIESLFGIKIRDQKLGGIAEIYLTNGSKIISMPGTPTSLQGFTGSVITDELSANSWDPDELMAQALSITSSNSKYRIVTCTNADVEGSYVHNFWFGESESFKQIRQNWKLFNLNIYDAYPEGLPDQIVQVKDSMSKSMWLRFYENTFLGEGTGLLETEYLRSRLSPLYPNKENHLWKEGLNFLAIDPGFSEKGNPAGVVVINIKDGKTTVVYEDLWFALSIEETLDRLAHLKDKYNLKGMRVDQGTVGYHLHKDMVKKFGSMMVKPVSVTGPAQYSWFTSVINLLEDRKISFLHDKFVIQDLSSISLTGEKLIVPERPLSVYKPKEPVIFPKTGSYKIHADAGIALCMLIPDILEYSNKKSYGFVQTDPRGKRRSSVIVR